MFDATTDTTYDLAIIGAGSGGMAAARRARGHGLSVVLFDNHAVGGTCVNAGCVPKKLLVHASRMRDGLIDAARAGWTAPTPTLDWPTLRDAVLAEVGRLSRLHHDRLQEVGVTIVPERAMIEARGVVRTDAGRRIEARDIVVATGARSVVPAMPGAAEALVSDDIFHLPALPKRLGIVGGGYIAAEFACMLHRFGVAVTVFEAGDRLIGGFDAEVAERLRTSMADQGIDVRTGTRIASLGRTGDGATITLEDGTYETFDEVLMAVGRRPNTDGLGLAELGVEMSRRGGVLVDANGRSTVHGLHAIGDAASHMMLTPVAVRDGRRCIDALAGRLTAGAADVVPTATFTTPECASVGLTEDEARQIGAAVEVRRKSFRTLTAVLSTAPGEVFVKAIVGTADRRLLGMHFFGPHAAEAAQMGAVALSAGLTEDELASTVPLHPSTAEEVIGLGDADMPIHAPAEAVPAMSNAPAVEPGRQIPSGVAG